MIAGQLFEYLNFLVISLVSYCAVYVIRRSGITSIKALD
jgi:hypothetical protein